MAKIEETLSRGVLTGEKLKTSEASFLDTLCVYLKPSPSLILTAMLPGESMLDGLMISQASIRLALLPDRVSLIERIEALVAELAEAQTIQEGTKKDPAIQIPSCAAACENVRALKAQRPASWRYIGSRAD
jgi:hypothetical protein